MEDEVDLQVDVVNDIAKGCHVQNEEEEESNNNRGLDKDEKNTDDVHKEIIVEVIYKA